MGLDGGTTRKVLGRKHSGDGVTSRLLSGEGSSEDRIRRGEMSIDDSMMEQKGKPEQVENLPGY